MVLGDRAGSRPELGDRLDTGAEALIGASRKVEASEVSSFQAQKVQVEIER